MNKRTWFLRKKQIATSVRFVVLAVGVFGSASLVGCKRDSEPKSYESIRFGLALQPSSATAMIASEKGYFEDARLNFQVTKYVSGKRALAGLLSGDVDAASTAQAPVVLASFERDDFCTIATIGSVTNVERIVARKDRGIQSPKDLKGKRIATQRGSAVHFFLSVFLAKYGLTKHDVQILYFKGEQLPTALINGEIDAFSMREPYVSQAVEALQDNAVVFAEPGIYYRTEHVVVSKKYLKEKRSAVERLLRALVRAEEFARRNPKKTKALVTDLLKIPASTHEPTKGDFNYRVALDQSIFDSMEDQARWVIASRLTSKTKVPNYLRFIHTRPLRNVKPSAVTVIE